MSSGIGKNLDEILKSEKIEQTQSTQNRQDAQKLQSTQDNINQSSNATNNEEEQDMIKSNGIDKNNMDKNEDNTNNLTFNTNLDVSECDTIKLGDILEKMIEINTIVRVERIFDESEVRGTKVINVVVNDGTRKGLLSLWGNQRSLLKDVVVGDSILIKDAEAPKLYNNRIHLKITNSGNLIKVKSNLPSLNELLANGGSSSSSSRKSIADLQEGDNTELRGLIVALHTKEPYFPLCDDCKKKMVLKKGYAVCKCGKKIDEEAEDLKWVFLVNVTLDDGTGTIRLTLNDENDFLDFKNLKKMVIDDENIMELLNKKLMGLDIVVSGYAKHNDYFDETIFQSKFWHPSNPVEEIKRYLTMEK
ncbi:hypothetical protein J3E07_001206 [Methanococcus voltae]|uniref:Nucleic acid binding OB-fold tRNA/helicase-type n=1 Tax=Methanococcus voltae TaxID=2188 RepID=A0A8J7UUX0_METVO|nr:DNA-binding protein [Methanococcus voltae]MBP2201781.1 hypothetical protein [Methanococcus voltae]